MGESTTGGDMGESATAGGGDIGESATGPTGDIGEATVESTVEVGDIIWVSTFGSAIRVAAISAFCFNSASINRAIRLSDERRDETSAGLSVVDVVVFVFISNSA